MRELSFNAISLVFFPVLFAITSGFALYYFGEKDQGKFILYIFLSLLIISIFLTIIISKPLSKKGQDKYIFFIFFAFLMASILITAIVDNNVFLESKYAGRILPNNLSIQENGVYSTLIQKQEERLLQHLNRSNLTDSFKKTISERLKELPELHKEGFFLIMGGSIWHTFSREFVLIAVSGKPILTLKHDGESLYLTGDFFSKDYKISSRLEDNKFTINQNNSFDIKRPNRHELQVVDNFGMVVLDVNFLHPRAMQLKGVFYVPSFGRITINEEVIIARGVIMSGEYAYDIKELALGL